MKKKNIRCLAMLLSVVMLLQIPGCGKVKKEPKPENKTTVEVTEGNANATGKGNGQSDIPLTIATAGFSDDFNPFSVKNAADRQVVELTQTPLFFTDRSGRLVYHGIDGVLREYKGEYYTYYGAADMDISYKEKTNKTVYQIKIRDDMQFSDGEPVTIDDVIFTIYVLCDNSYQGDIALKNMPIKGLLNYQANSNYAEKLSDKQVKKQLEKKLSGFKKWMVKRDEKDMLSLMREKKITYSEELLRMARRYLSKGKGKHVDSITGLTRVNDYELKVVTKGYCKELAEAFQIPICAKHYYGETSQYQYEKQKYGFTRGDISSVEKKVVPMGAGAYRYVKKESGIVYFTSNESYYLGCPKIAYVQLKDMTNILKETNAEIAQKLKEEKNRVIEEGEEEKPVATTNPSGEVTELKEGVVDVIQVSFRSEELGWISGINSNHELSGTVISTQFVSDGNYYYAGMNAKKNSIRGKEESNPSKYLRKAYAILLSAAKQSLKKENSEDILLVHYPMADELWVTPPSDEENGENYFAMKNNGEPIYTEDDFRTEIMDKAKQAALEYFELAGFHIQDGKLRRAPENISMRCDIWFTSKTAEKMDLLRQVFAKAILDLGLDYTEHYAKNEKELQKKIESGKAGMWISRRDIIKNTFVKQYASNSEENVFGIHSNVLDAEMRQLQKYLSSEERKEAYSQSFQSIFDLAIEVPICEFRDALLFSSARIKEETIPKNITLFYPWTREIQKVEMKK